MLHLKNINLFDFILFERKPERSRTLVFELFDSNCLNLLLNPTKKERIESQIKKNNLTSCAL